jgi:hypothetical protein
LDEQRGAALPAGPSNEDGRSICVDNQQRQRWFALVDSIRQVQLYTNLPGLTTPHSIARIGIGRMVSGTCSLRRCCVDLIGSNGAEQYWSTASAGVRYPPQVAQDSHHAISNTIDFRFSWFSTSKQTNPFY